MSKYRFPSSDGTSTTSEAKSSTGQLLKIYKPANLQPGSPLVLYFHGGGYAFGTVELDDALVCRYAKDAGLLFVSAEYRLTPQHRFPAGLDDCKAAFDWAIEHAESLGALPGKAAIMGGSAGATLALGTALKAIDAGQGNAVQGVVAVVPISCHPDAVPVELRSQYKSYDEHAQHTINTKSAMNVFLGRSEPRVVLLSNPSDVFVRHIRRSCRQQVRLAASPSTAERTPSSLHQHLRSGHATRRW